MPAVVLVCTPRPAAVVAPTTSSRTFDAHQSVVLRDTLDVEGPFALPCSLSSSVSGIVRRSEVLRLPRTGLIEGKSEHGEIETTLLHFYFHGVDVVRGGRLQHRGGG